MTSASGRERGPEKLDPNVEQVLLQIDAEIVKKIDRISETMSMERDRVVALAVLTLLKQIELRDEGKMILVTPILETEVYRDPLELVMREGPSGFTAIYEQVLLPRGGDE